MTPRMTPRERFACIHEAGHAFLFWYGGFVLQEVSVERKYDHPSADGLTQAFLPDTAGTMAMAGADRFSAGEIMALFGGKAGTDTYSRLDPGNGHRGDFETIGRLMKPDRGTLQILRFLDGRPQATVDDLYSHLRPRLRAILKSPQGQRAVLALARALGKYGSLSGQAAAAILQRAWGEPLPPKALPFERHMALNEKGPQCFDDLLRALQSYVSLALEDIRRLRGSGTAKQNKEMDQLWLQLTLLKTLTIPPP